MVTVRSTPEIHAAADAFFAPLAERLHAVLRDYSAAELELVDDVGNRLRATTAAYATAGASDWTPVRG